ncbi:MAG: GNAT family acetyltransferase, partial [Planctomycetaceae bacterium]|nr:GNAT family acetyltransferase [Planctomycetaceae bacterium]
MTADLTIRKFASSDSGDVIGLWDKVLPSSQPWNEPTWVICRKLSLNDGLFLVGEQNGEVIATVLAGNDGVRGWIYSLAVAEEYQRQGIGRQMLKAAEKTLLSKGCDKINLQVRADNSSVIEFYERCGFATEDRASLGKSLFVGLVSVSAPVPTIRVNDRITLSQITRDDKPAYLKHLNETDEFHERMGIMPYPYQEIDAEGWIMKVTRESLEADGRRNWAIRHEDGELIGGVGLFDLTQGEKSEIGYWLAKPYWGRGIVTEVVRRLCDFSFDQYQLHRIYAQAFSHNPASARVLEKAGFE